MKKIAAAFLLWLAASPSFANPYLPKPGERPLSMRISTCAVSGGFVHLYTALDNGLFDKYGIRLENIFIRGSAQNLTALSTDEVQFTYCASDAIIPGMAAGIDVKIVASPLVKLPYVLVTRKEVKRPEDLKGKSLGIARAGDLSDRLSRAVVKKLGLAPEAVTIRPIGGSQGERYQAMAAGIVHGVIITPPLDVRAKNEGFNIMYRLIELNIPFIYSSLHTSHKMLRERPEIVQRMVAAFAEIVHFVEKNPDKAKASIGKAMRTRDAEALQSAYDTYARDILDRTMVVPGKAVAETIELARESGAPVRRKAEEIYDNSFVYNLEKTGFMKEIWGSENYKR
ncbi:MAG TPA: ABC transporter substrate-binding protein [Candidatus Binatia bacterium]|jgi:NitT/TauT family transport system substrate-binding protein|nr:ABC transporter substrate-binding protein [Candidatus Binatia bacterium]